MKVIAEVKATSGRHLHVFWSLFACFKYLPWYNASQDSDPLAQSQPLVLNTFNTQLSPELVISQSPPGLVVLLL